MTTSDYLASGSLAASVIAIIYTFLTNTKKYELTSQYRSEVIGWFDETIKVLIDLKHQSKERFPNQELRLSLLSTLSAKIEVGRFYFPNFNTGNNFGRDKPKAYQGYRNLTLEMLVYSYRLYKKENSWEYLSHADTLERHFTSLVFEIIDPVKFVKDTERNTNKVFYKELSFEDFLHKEPELISKYIRDSE